MAKIYEIVAQTNKERAANSTYIVRNVLEQEHGVNLFKRTVNRRMNDICYWGTGVRRNINHDSIKNVEYRHKYLERRLANLTAQPTTMAARGGFQSTQKCFWMSPTATLTIPPLPAGSSLEYLLLSLVGAHCWSSLLHSWCSTTRTRRN
jgi:hypothetical protein